MSTEPSAPRMWLRNHKQCPVWILYPNILEILSTHENLSKNKFDFVAAQESWSPCTQIIECEINLQSPVLYVTSVFTKTCPCRDPPLLNFFCDQRKLKEMRFKKPDLLPIHVQETWSTTMLWSLKRIFAAVFISSSVESPYCLQSFIINVIIWSCK